MEFINGIHTFPISAKRFILFFVLALSFGYFSGFKFIARTTNLNPLGIEQNYNGNEEDEEAEKMKFKKPEAEILTTIHTHALSFSLIFFCLGVVLVTIPMNMRLKNFLLVEPFISIVITFGGIWLLWLDYTWMKYIVMISGILITVSFAVSVGIILKAVIMDPSTSSGK